MEISVNSPSYRRPTGVKTLDYIPFCRVWVDEGEADAYREANPGAEIIACPKGVQGNVARIRNYILDKEFERGMDAVLLLDDDIHCIERFEVDKDGFGYARHKLEADELMPFLEKYSQMCLELGFKEWGLNCNADAMAYRHYTPFSTTGVFIGGPFQCFLKGNRCRYDEELPLKEDYDMVIQQYNVERGILRLNAYHYLCEQSTIQGGCAASRNRAKEEQQFLALLEKWGSEIVKRDRSNKGGTSKEKKYADYNPIIKIPIKGV